MATKWGIVSAGKISNDFVAAVKSLDEKEHQIVAVAARSLSNAEEFASRHCVPKAYGSYEELAKDPNIEVVYIGSINTQHFPLGKLMLESGKHVLMEKPMTLNGMQTKALAEIARENKCFLMEALWSRFLPSYDCLMELVRNKVIGEIVHVDANLGFPMLHDGFRKAFGAGTILDLGMYPLNVVSMIYNNEKPQKIAAVGHVNDDGIDVSMTCSLQYTNNRTASVTTNAITQFPCDITITGTQGIIKVPEAMFVAKTIETQEKTYEFHIPEQSVPCNYPHSSGLKYEAVEVRKCLINGVRDSSIMPIKDSLLLADLMDEIRHQLGVTYFSENL